MNHYLLIILSIATTLLGIATTAQASPNILQSYSITQTKSQPHGIGVAKNAKGEYYFTQIFIRKQQQQGF